ncbi:MAG: choice-of-anchor D domain-containing protein, partial [Terracidiphilus sp.]
MRFGPAAAITCALFLSGCGGSLSSGSLAASLSNVTFGNVAVGQTASATITLQNQSGDVVQISQLNVSGQYFSSSGSHVSMPLSIAADSSYTLSVQFNPGAAGSMAGQLTVTSNASNGSSTAVTFSGTGVPVPSAVNCTSGAITGTGIDNCTVTLNAAAASDGQVVVLTSNSAAVLVPSTVTVPAGQTTASFTATIVTVSIAQSVAVTANVAGISESFALQLGGVASSSYAVDLAWDAPTSSPDPVAGYDIYRAASGSSTYQLLNPSVNSSTSYTDTTVADNTSYTYYIESVDAEGNQSVPS